MINYELGPLFWEDSIHKDLFIVTDDGDTEIGNEELHDNQFELTESITNGDSLVLGTCVSSSLKFTASNIFEELQGKWLNVSMYLGRNLDYPLDLGRFKVRSDIPTADRKKREIVAYDILYDIFNTNMASWYNYLLQKNTDTVTMELFRNSFFAYWGLEQEIVTLPNDSMIIEKTIEPTELSGKTVLNAICEINGCFGHIGRDGKFRYVFLEPMSVGIYPSANLYPDESLYPVEPSGTNIPSSKYIPPVTFENYITKPITGVEIRTEDEDVGGLAGSTSNAYVIQDNFLVYGKDAGQLKHIAQNILNVIKDIVFRPFKANAKGNPCIEVGDAIRLNTRTQVIESYVLNRTLKGIQSLRDTFITKGSEMQKAETNSVKHEIVRLKSKTNTLTRTVDLTRSELADLDTKTSTEIRQTSERITSVALDVDTLNDITTEHTSKIEQSAKSISLNVSNGTATAGIEITLTRLDGSEETVRDTINMTGMVTFSALETENTTTKIHGGNIITGTIKASQIDTDEIFSFFEVNTKYLNATSPLGSGGVATNYLDVTTESRLGEDAYADNMTVNKKMLAGVVECNALAVKLQSDYYQYADWQTVIVMGTDGNPVQLNFLGNLDVG